MSMESDEQNNTASKRKVRERWAESGQTRERLAFTSALVLLWSLGLWFVLTH